MYRIHWLIKTQTTDHDFHEIACTVSFKSIEVGIEQDYKYVMDGIKLH